MWWYCGTGMRTNTCICTLHLPSQWCRSSSPPTAGTCVCGCSLPFPATVSSPCTRNILNTCDRHLLSADATHLMVWDVVSTFALVAKVALMDASRHVQLVNQATGAGSGVPSPSEDKGYDTYCAGSDCCGISWLCASCTHVGCASFLPCFFCRPLALDFSSDGSLVCVALHGQLTLWDWTTGLHQLHSAPLTDPEQTVVQVCGPRPTVERCVCVVCNSGCAQSSSHRLVSRIAGGGLERSNGICHGPTVCVDVLEIRNRIGVGH
jgi:hypothetical protein